MCGEKVSSTSPIKCLKGSPPRMRGKVPQPGVEGCRLGITPAYAGKRGIKLSIASMIWDHPRVCGEKMVSMIPHRRSLGSPPRVRGKGSGTGGFQSLQGITPAYAGKRDRPRSGPGTTRDHPRVCGEKGDKVKHCFHDLGSPPRMRGKDGINDSAQAVTGITPACAGKRVRHRRISKPTRDHPRVCGEKGSSTFWSRNHSGSPPRMRGKGQVSVFLRVFVGITPACAGKSCSSSVSSSQRMSWTIRSRI